MAPSNTKEGQAFEEYVNALIDKKLEAYEINIKKEDADEIIKHIMPEMEKVVSKIVIKLKED